MKAQPLEQAERISRSIVEARVVDDDTLLLTADPAWTGAMGTVLDEKGVRVCELRRTEDRRVADVA